MSSHTHLNEWDLKTSECYITFSIDICCESLRLHENEAKSKRRQLTSNEWDWIGLSYVISGAHRIAILSRDGWCSWQVCMGLDKEEELNHRDRNKRVWFSFWSHTLRRLICASSHTQNGHKCHSWEPFWRHSCWAPVMTLHSSQEKAGIIHSAGYHFWLEEEMVTPQPPSSLCRLYCHGWSLQEGVCVAKRTCESCLHICSKASHRLTLFLIFKNTYLLLVHASCL